MASIKAILKINENGNGIIESVTTNAETRNISTYPYTTNVTSWFSNQTSANKNFAGATFNVLGNFHYGNGKYGVRQHNGTYTNQYNGLVFGCPSQLQNDFTITIVGTDVIAFKIYFDTLDGQTPTSYTVYSSISGQTTTYSSVTNGVVEVSGLLAGHGTTIITITGWQSQDEAIAIKYFENIELDIYMDKFWIDDFETQTQKTIDGESIQFGILANTGSITLKDKNKILLENSKRGYLNANLFTLDLYVNNRILQSHISNSAPYFTDNYTMKFELTNMVEKFKNTYISENVGSGVPAYEIFRYHILNNAFSLETKLMWEWTSNGDVELDIAQYLYYFESPSVFTLEGNVLVLLNKFCGAFGLQMYFEDNGSTIVLSSFRTRKYTGERILKITYEKQFSDFDYSILTTNRYDRVFFDDETDSTNYKNAVTLSKNEFFGFENTNQPYDSLEDILRGSILEDYAGGIKIAKISIFPSDLYTTTGVLAKKWNMGEIIEVNDVVRVENKDGNNVIYDKNYDEVYWRVIDRKVRYEGQILIDLVLQEIKN